MLKGSLGATLQGRSRLRNDFQSLMALLRSAQVPRIVAGPAGRGSCWPSSLTQTTSSQGLSVGLLPTGDARNPVREVSLWKEPVETRVGSLVSESPTRLSVACSASVTARSPGPRTVTGTLTKTHRIAVSGSEPQPRSLQSWFASTLPTSSAGLAKVPLSWGAVERQRGNSVDRSAWQPLW